MLERPYSLKLYKNMSFYTKKSLKLVNQQETFENNKGSSETIRKITFFNFDLFLNNTPVHIKKVDLFFLEWFIGFVEGEGSFCISKERLFFIIAQKDIKTLYLIRKNLGFGKVSFYNGSGRFIVSDSLNIFRLICLFNGNLLLDKTNLRFKNWLDVYNLNLNLKLEYYRNINMKLFDFKSNNWLSGFISAEGCFNSLIVKNSIYSLGYRFRILFLLDLKNEYELLESIKNSIGFGQVHIMNDLNNHRYIIDSFIGCNRLIRYLDQYKLYHISKFTSYLKWKKYFNIILNLKNCKEINIKRLIRLGRSIN